MSCEGTLAPALAASSHPKFLATWTTRSRHPGATLGAAGPPPWRSPSGGQDDHSHPGAGPLDVAAASCTMADRVRRAASPVGAPMPVYPGVSVRLTDAQLWAIVGVDPAVSNRQLAAQ